MSVDPVIQSPGNSQSINPYSYIMNNPLAGVDPSGYEAEKKETVEVAADAEVQQDTDGNYYVSAGDGSGELIQIDSVKGTTSNGSSRTVNLGAGGKVESVEIVDIGSQGLITQVNNSYKSGVGGVSDPKVRENLTDEQWMKTKREIENNKWMILGVIAALSDPSSEEYKGIASDYGYHVGIDDFSEAAEYLLQNYRQALSILEKLERKDFYYYPASGNYGEYTQRIGLSRMFYKISQHKYVSSTITHEISHGIGFKHEKGKNTTFGREKGDLIHLALIGRTAASALARLDARKQLLTNAFQFERTALKFDHRK
ncbi:hypothetical protein [Pseudoalteromonas sp. A25]|uniref:hypothetical protein n=1 Tax=Pseudoalteromonas sp. A25 TaxID=116092 RepID=UPI001E294476